MTPSKKDIILIGILALAFGVIGFILGHSSGPTVVVSEDSKFVKIYSQIDSLRAVDEVVLKHIASLDSQGVITDSEMSANLKNIANEVKVIKKFTPTSRSRYLDSLLAVGDFK